MFAFFSVVLIGLFSFSNPTHAFFNNSDPSNFNNSNSDFVTADQAFPFFGHQVEDTVYLKWDILKGYYLYQHRLSVSVENAEIGEFTLQEGRPYHDEFFGSVNIYTAQLNVKVPLLSAKEGGKLIVQYQGCAEAGFCYPPETKVIPLSSVPINSLSVANRNSVQNNIPRSTSNTEFNKVVSAPPISKASELASHLADNWWTPLIFLVLGVGLAFTPCVFPMYPILTGIVLGSGKLSHVRALGLSFIYVQGMAFTYTLLGLVVASAGLQFQAALQHPYVLIGVSVVFILLALSMFGLYTIQLPSSIQTWLSNQSNRQQGGNILGVFIMGAISGLVCSPCTTAPLSGALLYVAQSGDLFTGAITLYALGLGMGTPVIIVAVFGNKLLPKAGDWMNRIKVLFGFILLAAPIFLIERIIPEAWAITLWGGLGIAVFGWLYYVKNNLKSSGWKQSLMGIVAVLGLVVSIIPVYNQWIGDTSHNAYQPQVSFIRITSVSDLEEQLIAAKKANKPVMLDFYADWCVACKEFEKYTFHTPEVESKLKDFVLLQADVTKNSSEDIELFKRLQVMGLPTIDFWDANGNYIPSARLTGFIEATPFIKHLKSQNLE